MPFACAHLRVFSPCVCGACVNGVSHSQTEPCGTGLGPFKRHVLEFSTKADCWKRWELIHYSQAGTHTSRHTHTHTCYIAKGHVLQWGGVWVRWDSGKCANTRVSTRKVDQCNVSCALTDKDASIHPLCIDTHRQRRRGALSLLLFSVHNL